MKGQTVVTTDTAPETAGLDVTAMDEIIGYRLRRAQLYIFQEFNARFAKYDLRPSDYSILVLIEANPGCRQGEVADALGIKRANFVALIKALDDRGFTRRRTTPGDRRAHALHLTDEGRRFLAEVQKTQAEFERHCIERLGGPEARDTLITLLDRLTGDIA